MTGAAAGEDDVDFDFLVSYNNSSYMALANAPGEIGPLPPTIPCTWAVSASVCVVQHVRRTESSDEGRSRWLWWKC